MANQSIGKVEIGDIYEDTESGRRVKIGRLSVDQGSNEFFQKPVGRRGRATRLSAEDVATMLSQGKIVCDQQSAKTDLINYIRVLTESRNSVHDAEIERIKNRQRTEEMDRNKRIHAKVKRKVHVARLFWLLACGTMVATVFIASIPAPSPAPAEKTIAGEGQNYGIDPDALSDSTYIEAMGSGSTMYGIVTDQNIVENGQESSGESAIKENAMFTPAVSKTQPLHMRPLTYDKQTFYQTAIKTNDINGGSTGVYLQNPNGNSLGVASNELVLAGGAGLGTIIISSPEKYEDKSASTTAKDIEAQQQQAATDSASSSSSSSEMPGGKMQEAWNGFDSCDIDGNVIVGSYWYTKDASLEKKDLKRRIAVFNIKDVLAGSSDAVSNLEAVQLNYQDFDNDYYNPVVSESPASNGSTYWIGYTKQTEDGDTGFFIRCYENNNDLLMEDYENTFSTSDITGNSDPITNYTLFGDKLFYEQRGAIWVIDLSKLSANVDDYKRTIERENPVKIVDVIDMRASTTRDEQHIADLMGETVKPSCHYKVMTITTSKGVEYGIVFIDAQTGDLIYQPCYTMTTAASAVNNGGNTDSSTADEVTDLNEARIDELREEKEKKSHPSSSKNSNSDDEENDNASSKNKNKGNSEDSGKTGDITMTGYHVDSAARVMLAASGSKANLSYRQAADEETDSTDSSDTGEGENATDEYTADGESGNSNGNGNENENSDSESANDSENENADDSASVNADKAKAKNLNSSLGDDDTEEDRGTALTGRVIIRKGTKNNVSILSYTIRGEQVVWLEEKQDDTKKREIRLSPIYYKDTSVQEADENAGKDDKTKSSLDGDNENGANANASEILKSGVNENAEEAVKDSKNENAGNDDASNTESDEEKAAAAAAAQAQAEEAKRKQEEADALRAEQERLANTPKTEFEDVE